MKVLVVGGGGREHALVWKLKQSEKVDTVFCAPGNAGISKLATCVDIAVGDINALLAFAKEQEIDLTVVGPEEPLSRGIVDLFGEHGLRIFGPSSASAALEWSKVFAKGFLQKYHIPSAEYKSFDDLRAAQQYIRKTGAPCVVKADGLAAGKGVILAGTVEEACAAVDLIMKDKAFGEAGNQVVVEAFLRGEEASFIAFTDGKTVLPLPSSQDHKAVFDGDQGPNTGGMGAYSPAPVVDESLTNRVMEEVMLPTVRGMAAEGRPCKGMLYAGLMIDEDKKINVLEFNCRFGDPECQPLVMRLQTDLLEILLACIDEKLDQVKLETDPRPSVCVVMASEGYPGKYATGFPISGLDQATGPDVEIFHAGTRSNKGEVVSSGGRVLGVTALGKDIGEAIDRAYQAAGKIRWQGCFYRKDIGHRALARLERAAEDAAIARVGIVMGSDSDLSALRAAADFLTSVGVRHEMRIASAHRTPEVAVEYAKTARQRGLRVIIAGAGMAAHLAGVLAAHTTLPVIGVPLDASSLGGLDALLSTVQMPPGIPVATMGIGKAGAKNAAVLAARILAIRDPVLQGKLENYSREMAEQVAAKNRMFAG